MEFVCVGKIIKPQGIKGEVKILPLVDIPAIFNGKHNLYIDCKESKYKTSTFRLGYGYVLFEEIIDRNVAEKYRNKLVYISREDFDKLAVDEYLIDDLIGRQIFDENGEFLGQIMDIENYGFDDILVIKQEEHLYEVPFRKDIFKKQGRDFFAIRNEFEGAKVSQEW